MANFEVLQPANEMKNEFESGCTHLPAQSNNTTGPLSPYVAGNQHPKRFALQSIAVNVPASPGGDPNVLFKEKKAILKPHFILSPLRTVASPNTTMDSEYGFGDLITPSRSTNTSRRNSLDDDVCDELRNAPVAMGVIEETEAEAFEDDHGFGWESSGKVPYDGVEILRAKENQQLISGVRMVNHEQLGGSLTGVKPSYGFDSAEISRQMNIPKPPTVNNEKRGELAGAKTEYGVKSAEMSRQLQAPKAATVNEQFRGEHLTAPKLETDAAFIKLEMQNQEIIADYRRINEQIIPDYPAAKILPDCVEVQRTIQNQALTADVRIVNEQMHGPAVGKKTLFNTDSAQLSNEMSAQVRIATQTRVSEQARGEFAGKQTKFDANAISVQHATVQQTSIAENARVNEQILCTGIGTIPSDSVENVRSKNAQNLVAEVGIVNEQVRNGPLAGKKTAYGTDSRQMRTEQTAQQTTNEYRRVNEQARGEMVGRKTHMDRTSMIFTLARDAPKVQLVNNQIANVVPGTIPTDSLEQLHVRSKRLSSVQNRSDFKGSSGKSMFGADATEIIRIANVPKPVSVNNQIRGEGAGRSAYDATAKDFQRSVNAPKPTLINDQIRCGNVSRDAKADASAFDKASEWTPSTWQITRVDELEKTIEIPEESDTIRNTPKQPEWSNAASMFELATADKNFTLERQKKRESAMQKQEAAASTFDNSSPSSKFSNIMQRFR